MRKILLLSLLSMGASRAHSQIYIQSYEEALNEARQGCGLPLYIRPVPGARLSTVGSRRSQILGGYDGERRGLNECSSAKAHLASTNARWACAMTDAVGVVLGVGGGDSSGDALSRTTLACLQAGYTPNLCIQEYGTPCFESQP